MAELRTTYRVDVPPVLGMALGRVVVLVRGGGLATRRPLEQVAEARGIAVTARAHLATGPWYTRRLVDRALTVVFEDRTVESGCEVWRYVECTVLAPER